MYRTPVRPAQSPDNIPEIHHSPPSWADSSSPGRPRRSRSQGRSPGRSHRSRSRGRSRSRSRSRCSRSRGRSKSRTRRSRSRDRSRSRPRRSRSRGRSRHSPSEESRYSYERRSSPCFLSAASSDPSAPHNDPLCMRAEEHAGPGPRALDRYDGRSVGPRASASGPGDVPGKYHAVGELPPSGFPPVTPNFQAWAKDLKRPPEEPLPMPKKSILKKRPEVESGNTAGVQINSYSSHKEMSTTYLFPSANPSLMERAAGSSSSSSAGIIGRGLADDTSTLLKTGAQANQNSPTGSTAGLAPKVINESGFPCSNSILAPSSGEIAPPASANNQTSSGSGAQLGLEETKSSQYSSKMGNFLHMFNKSACEAQGIPYNPSAKFPDPKGAAQQKAQPPKSAASPNEPPKDSGNKMVPAPKRAETSKPPEKKFRSRAEIEDEERFLYGDEELKKPTPGAVNRPPASAAPKPVAHSPPASAQSAPSPTPAPSTSVPKNLANKQQYEKIHDLLKTIGLDIGVAEIGKLAVRTQERLHGKKSLPGGQTPECRPSVTDPKPADSRPRKHDMSPAARRREPESPTTHELDAKPIPRLKDHTPPATQAIPSLSEPTPAPISPSQMQVYSPYPSGAQIMPSYGIPPPAYNPYTPYVAYPTSSWSVYSQVHQPPPTHVAPPLSHMVVSHSTTISRSNLRVIETSENAEVLAAGKKEALAAQVHQLIEKQEAERNNKEIEKQKVLEELDDLRREQRTKTASLDSLCAKVEQLRVQQGILLRKKRREKDGHKDPLLEELNNAVENAQKQLSVLRKELQAAIQKQQQLTKVAEILGAAPAELADRRSPAHASKDVGPTIHSSRDSGSHFRNTNNAKSKDDSKSSSEPHSKSDPKPSGGLKSDGDPKPRSTPPKSNQKTLSRSRASSSPSPEVKARPKSPRPGEPTAKTTSKESLSIDLSQLFEYYDEGYHWCEDCGSVCTTVIDYLLHMHSKKHVQMSNPPKRPWTKKTESEAKPPGRQTLAVPMKGLEFLFPTNGFYCQLCEELFADQTCAEQHLRTFAHNDKYKKYTDDNPQYEQKRQNKQKAVAEEALHKQKDEQKRKLFEQFNESAGESKFKRARPDDDEEESAKQKQSAVAPPSAKPDPRQNLKPERSELGRTQSFGKFSWKTQESKSQNSAGEASKDESAVHGRQKEEEGKTHAARNKSIEIKLMGKGSASHGSSCSSSTASPSLVPQTKVRPNLPVPINVLRKSGVAPLSKPAPLNTFLSIKSSSKFSSKPPKAEEMSQEASKAFGGQEKEKRELSQNQVVGKAVSGPESSGKKALESSGQKSDLQKMPPPHVSAGTQKGRSSEAFDMFHKDKEPEKKLSPNLHPGSFKAAGTKAVQIKNEPSASGRNEASKSPISAQKGNVSETPRLAVSASVSPSSNKQPQRADGVEPTQSGKNSTGSQQAQAKAAANKPTTKSNPVSAAAITPQKCAPSPVSQQGKTSPAVIPPVDSAGGTGSVYSNTAKLIQKFKREPLPLPTSLFCHGPDKRSSSSRVPNASSSTPIISSRNQTAPGHASARPRFQEGIESYYKLVAPEDDPEDVTTSEDQDAEADAPVGVVVLPVQPKSTIPEKKADKPPVTAQVPESADDADDSDMACEEEAPEAPAVTVFTGSPKTHATSTLAVAKSPLGAAGARLDSPNTEVEMDISPEYSMEDLAVMTTCDSD